MFLKDYVPRDCFGVSALRVEPIRRRTRVGEEGDMQDAPLTQVGVVLRGIIPATRAHYCDYDLWCLTFANARFDMMVQLYRWPDLYIK